MRNPWAMPFERPPYVVLDDEPRISKLNCSTNENCRIDDGLLPEPFIGGFDRGTVALLNLNPSWHADDSAAHGRKSFREAVLRNLWHKQSEYPFYPLHLDFGTTPAGRWYRAHLRMLMETLSQRHGLKAHHIAQRLCVIEWFPYHSKHSNAPAERWSSQQYGFHFARNAVRLEKLVIVMRSAHLWRDIDWEDADVTRIRWMKCRSRRPWITPENIGETLFCEILNALANDKSGAPN